jgi:hypothetical protein
MSQERDDEANDEPRLMTSIDGAAARLLVHIEPIKDPEVRPTATAEPAQGDPPDDPR